MRTEYGCSLDDGQLYIYPEPESMGAPAMLGDSGIPHPPAQRHAL
jgi:hypothetical protein